MEEAVEDACALGSVFELAADAVGEELAAVVDEIGCETGSTRSVFKTRSKSRDRR